MVPGRAAFSSNATTVFIVCPFYGDSGQTHGRGEAAKSGGIGIFKNLRKHYRDQANFYANPRSVSYQLGAIKEFCSINGVGENIDLALDENLAPYPAEDIDSNFKQVYKISLFPTKGLRDRLQKQYDNIVIVYSDAIGLGCEEIEKAIASHSSVFVINGRRRAFKLSLDFQKALNRRRFYCKWRIVEALLAFSFIFLSGAFALSDWLNKKDSSERS